MPTNVIVAGLTRSGLTATCHMLAAGGMNVAGKYPDFEPFPIGTTPWGTIDGQVVKLVDSHLHLPPQGTYAVIRLRRNPDEQFKSFEKWVRTFSTKATVDRGRVMASFERDYTTIDEWVARQHKFMMLDFERIIEHPSDVAQQLSEFLGVDLNKENMSSAIVRRSHECYPGLLELMFLATSP